MSSLVVPTSFGTGFTAAYAHNNTLATVVQAPATSNNADFETVLKSRTPHDNYERDIKHLAGSNLPVGDMTTTIEHNEIPSVHTTIWARLSEFECPASNQDRSTSHVQMLRVWKSNNQSTNYLGRADTKDRLLEQVQFILNQEKGSNNTLPRGLQEKDGTYTFTYFVNSLTKLGKMKNLSPLDERESFIKEQALLSGDHTIKFSINDQEVDVKIKPVHIHQNISGAGELTSHLFNDDLSGKSLENTVNKKGYEALFALIPSDHSLAQALKSALETEKLSVRKRFIFTDILQRLAGQPAVYHCKSSVDRGGTAAALGATNAYFLEKNPSITKEELETLIDSEDHKEMFFAQICRSHQESSAARFGRKEDGGLTGKGKLFLKMNGSLMTDSLPKDMVKETSWEKSKGARMLVTVVATIAYILFYPVIIAFMFSIGHLLVSIAQLGLLPKKGPSIAGRLEAFHVIPYALTPWNIHKTAHRHIDYTSQTMKAYLIVK